MFVLTTIADTVRIPPPQFCNPTVLSVHTELEQKYPNRVIMDLGLVICRHGDALEIGDGVFVPGDGCAHHEVVVRLVVFRPFVEEVCVGVISESNEEGLRVSLGDWFHDIFIPAYWMLRPSRYDEESGFWVWTQEGEEGEDAEGFEMELGSEIRFKVKAINFTQITDTIKGVQATTTSTKGTSRLPGGSTVFGAKAPPSSTDATKPAADGVIPKKEDGEQTPVPVRKRSSSVDMSDSPKIPASMHITASICEDGLGLVNWWSYPEEEEEEEEEGEEEKDGLAEGGEDFRDADNALIKGEDMSI